MGRRFAFALLAGALILTGCTSDEDPAAIQPLTTGPTVTTTETTVLLELSEEIVWTTSGDISGNRFTPGRGALLEAVPVDVALSGVPRWVIGADTDRGLIWVVALDDGRLEALRLENGQPVREVLNIDRLAPGTPPVVISGPEGLVVVEPPEEASDATSPLPLPDGGLVYVADNGTVVAQVNDHIHRFEVDALPDTRISISESGLIAVLAEATTRYPHGVVGDELEAGRVTVIDPLAGEVVAEGVVPEPSVIEGIAALWADLDGDGQEEILVTVSDGVIGARLVVFDRRGKFFAEGPAIGRGNRWRNQLGAAPLGPSGEIEIVDVRVPHIGGVVEFFRLEDGRLTTQAELTGFTSHTIGSRNLDLALTADADGDGRIEVVVPTQARDAIGLLRRSADGVEVVSQLELPGTLRTNLAAGVRQDGFLAFAAGTDQGVLRIWPAAESE